MAATDGTNVAIDANADGTAEINVTLDRGQSYLLDGGVLTGGAVNASAPVQVAMITGDRCDIYEYALVRPLPRRAVGDSYWPRAGHHPRRQHRASSSTTPADTVLSVAWDTVGGARTTMTSPPAA
ncbi:MAG: hypothetical protein R2856_27460 [Caldilineaceae bacterium]